MVARWKPMLASPADTFPSDLEAWTLEPKWDGWRALVVIESTGVTVIGGRNGNTYNGKVPYIESALAGALPVGTVLDGEIVSIDGKGWGSVQSVMTGKFPHKPSAAEPALTFVAFDILQANGNELMGLPWEQRRSVLEMIEWPTHTHLTPTGPATEAAHIAMIENGMEGSMLKSRHAVYQPGKRSPSWVKLKAIATEDCTIIGWEEGNNGRSGEIGALIVQLDSGVQTTVSGMTDKVRADMLANFDDKYRWKMVEVAHNGVMDSGKLRHPRYKRMRDDKTPVAPPRVPSTRSPSAKNARMRNYKAMGDPKLREAVDSFKYSSGDAFVRASNDPNFTVEAHTRACYEAARLRGWATPAFF